MDEQSVSYYISRLKDGYTEEAFHSLIEAGPAILPSLQEAFRTETDPDVKAVLVEVIWQSRLRTVIPFLSEALADPHPRVWKAALDGLVTLGGSESIAVLEQALVEKTDQEFSEWVREALEQMERT